MNSDEESRGELYPDANNVFLQDKGTRSLVIQMKKLSMKI